MSSADTKTKEETILKRLRTWNKFFFLFNMSSELAQAG